MRRCVALLAVVLALPLAARAQSPAPGPVAPADADPEVARVKQRLATPTPVLDAVLDAPVPTFRVSVTKKVDIWKFWSDDPSVVASMIRPRGGSWHHEFQNMVTPDEFKGYGGILGNGEKLQLAATSLAFAGAMKLLGIGIQRAGEARVNRAERKAKDEVQRELAEFCAANPGACPATPLTPP